MLLLLFSLVNIIMNRILTLFAFLVSLFLISSCASQVSVLTNISSARNSFVKVESWVGLCDQEEGRCFPEEVFSVGSGSMIMYGNKKNILTAAHVCDLGPIGKKIEKDGGRVTLKVVDRDGKSHIAEIIRINHAIDACLLRASSLNIPALRISVKKPEYAERVYNIASPMGIAEGNMVPIFQGIFFGNNGGRAFYSIPTIGGASGSPILNIKGEVVGMVHSVHYRFHHVSLSVTYADLWNFLESSRSHTTILQNLCPRLGCEQSRIEEFLLKYDTFE